MYDRILLIQIFKTRDVKVETEYNWLTRVSSGGNFERSNPYKQMDNQPQLAVSTDNIFMPVPADSFVENLRHLESFGKIKDIAWK